MASGVISFTLEIDKEIGLDTSSKMTKASAWEEFLSQERSVFVRYGFSVFISVMSLILVAQFRLLEEGAPFSTFAFLTVILSAIYGGKGPAFLDTLVTSIGLDYLVFAPYFEVFDSYSSFGRIFIFMLVGFLVSTLVESLKESFIKIKNQKNESEMVKRARENVLGVVSHDLRSPLSSILMNTELLLRSNEIEPKSRKRLESIKNSASRMNHQIEDLLDAVKVESGQFRVQIRSCSLNEVVRTAVAESVPSALSNNISIKVNLPASDERIDGDPLRLIQVLNNLLSNAIKFSPPDTDIFVSVLSTSEHFKIQIKDSGAGIPQDDQQHLFDRYWQAPGSAHKGTGLGLFISRSIIQLHQGHIEVSSRIGNGSTFTITLPKHVQQEGLLPSPSSINATAMKETTLLN